MTWGKWIQGLIAAIFSALSTAVSTIVVLPGDDILTKLRDALLISIFPTILAFLFYIKNHVPPIGE